MVDKRTIWDADGYQPLIRIIPPLMMAATCRIHAAIFSFMAGVMPPMPMFGRSLL